MIQDVVPLLAGSNLDELPQEKWCSLGDGGQFCDVLRLAFQAVDLHKQRDTLRNTQKSRTPGCRT